MAERARSASGHTRKSADVCDTTASPPEADFGGSLRDVAEGPEAVIALHADRDWKNRLMQAN